MTTRSRWQSFLHSPPALLVYGVACWALLVVFLVMIWTGAVWLVHEVFRWLVGVG